MQNGADAFVPPCLLPSLRLRSHRVGLTRFRRALVLAFDPGAQPKSEIRGDQLVGTFASASVNLHGGGMDQVAVRIERSEKPCLVSSDAGLDSPQRILLAQPHLIGPSCPKTARPAVSRRRRLRLWKSMP
jgi:hypothetical protein